MPDINDKDDIAAAARDAGTTIAIATKVCEILMMANASAFDDPVWCRRWIEKTLPKYGLATSVYDRLAARWAPSLVLAEPVPAPAPSREGAESLVAEVFASCDAILNGRGPSEILAHTMTELGELAQEVIIAEGRSYKAPGADGVTGEAIDLMLCALDMIRVENPDMTETALIALVRPKLAKWRATTYKKV